MALCTARFIARRNENALRQLIGDVVSHQLGVQLGTLDLLDVDPHFLPHQLRQLVTQLVYLGAFLSDDDAWPPGMHGHHDLARLPLNVDVRDRRVPDAGAKIFPQQLVLFQQLREIALRVPARAPLLRDSEPKANRIGLLSHATVPSSLKCPGSARSDLAARSRAASWTPPAYRGLPTADPAPAP